MRLYKFVSSIKAVMNMASGLLKFTPIEELNDPSELTPIMDREAVKKSLELLRINGMTEEQFEWLKCQSALLGVLSPETKIIDMPKKLEEVDRYLKYSVYEDLDYLEDKLFDTINNIRSRVGILSLTDRYDSLPMWAHYANLAKGFVVVLDGLQFSFKGDNTRSLNTVKPVCYLDQLTGMTFDPSTQNNLFFLKFSDWSYEREWRVVTALASCKRDENIYLRKIDRSRITAVICGWRVCETYISLLKRNFESVNPSIRITSAFMKSGKVLLTDSLQ